MNTLTALLGDIGDAVEALDRYLLDLPAEVTVDELVIALKQATGIAGLKTLLSAAITTLENTVSENLPADTWTVAYDGGQVQAARKWSAGSTKWDTSACWSAVVSAASEAGYDPLLVLPDVAAVSYFRVKPLKDLGVNPDQYRTQEGGRWRIVLD